MYFRSGPTCSRSKSQDNIPKQDRVKKANYLQCRTDKTPCRIPCPKCKCNTGFSKLFKSTENVWRHLFQIHRLDKNDYPSIEYVIFVLEKISIALEKGIKIETIPEVVKLEMIIK